MDRLAIGSVLTLTLGTPAVALADMATDPGAPPDPDAHGSYECPQTCAAPNTPQAPPEDEKQAAEQSTSQSSYQFGSKDSEQPIPSHPYSQAHYQLGAGHQD